MYGTVKSVQAAEDAVAVVFTVGDDTDGDGADSFFKGLNVFVCGVIPRQCGVFAVLFAQHPLVYAPEMALAFVDSGFDIERL